MPKELKPFHTNPLSAPGFAASGSTTPRPARSLRSGRRRSTRPSTPTSAPPTSYTLTVRSLPQSPAAFRRRFQPSSTYSPPRPFLTNCIPSSHITGPSSCSSAAQSVAGSDTPYAGESEKCASQGAAPVPPSPALSVPHSNAPSGQGQMINASSSSMRLPLATASSISSSAPGSSPPSAGPCPVTLTETGDEVNAPSSCGPISSHRLPASAWSSDDDKTLQEARKSGMNWAAISATYFPHKSPNACRKRHERLVQRQANDSWDDARFDVLSVVYIEEREKMWGVLARRLGENWRCVEEKCMEKGLKFLLTRGQSLPPASKVDYAPPESETEDMLSDPTSDQVDEVMLARQRVAAVLAVALQENEAGGAVTNPAPRPTLAPVAGRPEKNDTQRAETSMSIQSILRSD